MTGPRRGSLLVIFLTVFIDLLGFGIVLPLLPIYGQEFARQYGWSKPMVGLTVGLLMSSFSVMQFFFLPIWGRLSDRYGRRPILLIGLAGSTLFYGLFGVATSLRSLTGLFITRIGAGIAGATIATAQAYIADTTSKEGRTKGMALIGAAFALGFTLGPSLGIVALLAGGEIALSPWPGYLASGLSGVAFLMAQFLLPESFTPGTSAESRRLLDWKALRAALSVPSLGFLLVSSFIAVFSFANFESTLSLQIEQMLQQQDRATASGVLGWLVAKSHAWGYEDPAEVRLIVIFAVFIALGFTLALAQGFLVRRLAGRVSEGLMAGLGAVTAIVGFLLLSVAASQQNFHLLLGAMTIEVTGFALVNPSLQSLISRRSNPAEQGGILGVSQSFASLARILGPLLGITLFASSPNWPYLAALALMAGALVMIALAIPRGRDFSDAP